MDARVKPEHDEETKHKPVGDEADAEINAVEACAATANNGR